MPVPPTTDDLRVDDVLEGTPYSLPPEAEPALQEMRGRLKQARTGLDEAVKNAKQLGLLDEMARANAVYTVYESNSLEFTGPDLAGTFDAIHSTTGQNAVRDLNVNLLPEMMKRDPETYAALGLEMARTVAMRYVGTGDRGLTQSDLRALHTIVMKGSYFAGRYRVMGVDISQSDHHPFPGFSIDPTMRDYAAWSRKSFDPDLAILRAAIGHAWFTHIHPFYDGNGRVARLTTNVMLGQDGLPPAIVKAKSQRGQYIGALAHSDEGGDILPLTGLFLSTVERYVRNLTKPKAFTRLFDDLVARRGNSYFTFYAACVQDFMTKLGTELALHNLTLTPVDQLTRDVFEELRSTGYTVGYRTYYPGSPWGRPKVTPVMSAVVTDENGQELVIYTTLGTAQSRGQLTKEEYVPSLGFAVPNEKYRLLPYRRASPAEAQGLSTLWLVPGRPIKVYAPGVLSNSGATTGEAASDIAERLRKAFADQFTAPEGFVSSSSWLSRRDGGEL